MKRRLLLFVFFLVACGQPIPMTSAYVVQSFKDADLNITSVAAVGNVPINAVEGTQFELPNVGNGKVLTFQSAADAADYAGYMSGAGAKEFQKGIVVIELSVSVDESTARQYQKILNDLKF